ncbi:MAG: hypothetical protein WC005_06920, partial [Candidatus Nanopelagicales bacterium]
MSESAERLICARAQDGARVGIDLVGDDDALLESFWPPTGLERQARTSQALALRLSADLQSIDSLTRLESDLGLFAAEHLVDEVAVHAAIIKADDQVIVLPGESMTGKSTLCAAAHTAGHAVLSDEYVLIDPESGWVRGWPRSLRLRVDGQWVRRGVARPHEPVAVTLIAAIAYDDHAGPDAGLLDLEPMTPGEVAMLLLANTVCAQARPEDSLRAASALARQA